MTSKLEGFSFQSSTVRHPCSVSPALRNINVVLSISELVRPPGPHSMIRTTYHIISYQFIIYAHNETS
jgi:hypothetical protein